MAIVILKFGFKIYRERSDKKIEHLAFGAYNIMGQWPLGGRTPGSLPPDRLVTVTSACSVAGRVTAWLQRCAGR